MERSDYDSVRSKIVDGDLLLCSGNYSLSRLIRKVSGSPYSHVAFVIWIKDRLMVMESIENIGVRTVPLSSYVKDYLNSKQPYDGEVYICRHRAAYKRSSEESMSSALIQHALDLMGKRYDTEDLAKIALRLTTGVGQRDADDAYICSEFVADCFARIDIYFKERGGFVLPSDIGEDSHVETCFKLV